MNTLEIPGTTKTLRQRLDEGRIPVKDGLRYVALLAEALCELHDKGRAHGAVTADAITLTDQGIDLLPSSAAAGKPVDARSDVLSFGAVVFEMLTGRKVFDAAQLAQVEARSTDSGLGIMRLQQAIDALSERVAFLEQDHGSLESLREQVSELHLHVAADMHEFELNLKTQSNVIESARTAMAQTDNLVERVVEALESLQTTVLERSENRKMALN
jgi:hypothetical protein